MNRRIADGDEIDSEAEIFDRNDKMHMFYALRVGGPCLYGEMKMDQEVISGGVDAEHQLGTAAFGGAETPEVLVEAALLVLPSN